MGMAHQNWALVDSKYFTRSSGGGVCIHPATCFVSQMYRAAGENLCALLMPTRQQYEVFRPVYARVDTPIEVQL